MSFWFSCLPAKFICMCMFFSGIVFFFCCHAGGPWGYLLSFGGVICQVINVECSMVFNLLCFLGLFSCRHLAFQFTFPPTDTCTFVFCIWGFAFVAFLLSLVAYACFLVELFVFLRWCIICFVSYWFCYQFYLIVRTIYLCFTNYAAISGAECSLVLYLRLFFALFFM